MVRLNHMRKAIIAVLFLAACATTNAPITNSGGHVNVALVRHEINEAIAAQHDARTIVSMGHVTKDSAVVYTSLAPNAPRHEETWVRGADGWRLDHTADVGGSAGPSAAR
jgi:hypothetical protein